MAKEIILYNLRDDVKEEDYVKWCEEYKGPLLLGLPGSRSFTLTGMLPGIKGNGQKGIAPTRTSPPYRLIGIMDLTTVEEWDKSHETSKFKDFFAQWFSKWVGDFYVMSGVELYYGEKK
jgi:hypothetical protein